MEAATKRASHDSVLLELTRSICPRCRRVLEAEVLARDGKVFLRKRCSRDGEFEALVYGDAQRYIEIQRYNKPGERPLRLQTEVVEGCPRDCGICPEHKQHTCLGIIEVNTGCNLDCPICFAESGTGHQPDGYSLTLEQVERMLDAFVEAEGEPEAIQLSGGEPSIHPQILDMLGGGQGARHQAGDAQHQRDPPGAGPALRTRAGGGRRARLPPVRRLQGLHPPGDSRAAAAG